MHGVHPVYIGHNDRRVNSCNHNNTIVPGTGATICFNEVTGPAGSQVYLRASPDHVRNPILVFRWAGCSPDHVRNPLIIVYYTFMFDWYKET